MTGLGDVLGELCRVTFPIPEEFYDGNPDSTTAVCTLSSIDMLRQIVHSGLLDRMVLAGRLFSENRGIDSLVKYVYSHKTLRTIIICGKEVPGHRAGHSLIQLHKNGVDGNYRIVNSTSPEPFLTVTAQEIAHFRERIVLVDRVGMTDIEMLKRLVQ